MENKIRKTIESQGWFISKSEDGWDLSKFSPLGEDFYFYVEDKFLVEKIRDFADTFDADEHADLYIPYRGTNGIPNSIRDLIEDADFIAKDLLELAAAVEKAAVNDARTKSSK